jgi:hypothetical protein
MKENPLRHPAPLFSACIALALIVSSSAHTHHSFSAEFDANAPISIKGKVTKVEWINPHAWIHVDVAQEDESHIVWMVEGGTPNTLLRAGINKNTIAIGTEIVVRGYQAKDKTCKPACKANGRDVTLADGRALFMGSSGTGAPRDGTDPREPSRKK